jgi:hypothetical protein
MCVERNAFIAASTPAASLEDIALVQVQKGLRTRFEGFRCNIISAFHAS